MQPPREPTDDPHAAGPRASGRLSVVGTPIGNLDDITVRALATLRAAHLVLAEDTRHTRKLLVHHGIGTPLRALHAHSSERDVERCVELLSDGRHLALVSDAGMPLISDPGSALVAAVTARGLPIETVPGPSAVLAALSVCGLPFDSFRFVGFAPRTGRKREAWLAAIAGDPGASVFFESPVRLHATLVDLHPHLAAGRMLAVCRELTKAYEEVVRGDTQSLAEHFSAGARGEITVVVGAGTAQTRVAESQTDPEQSRIERIDALLTDGVSARDAARQLARELGRPRRELYAEVLTRANARGDRLP